jgi:hypothetical protein
MRGSGWPRMPLALAGLFTTILTLREPPTLAGCLLTIIPIDLKNGSATSLLVPRWEPVDLCSIPQGVLKPASQPASRSATFRADFTSLPLVWGEACFGFDHSGQPHRWHERVGLNSNASHFLTSAFLHSHQPATCGSGLFLARLFMPAASQGMRGSG